MALTRPERMTQRKIAELAGVSQATVSLVLNGRTDATTRIPEETRQRVLQVIRDTDYAADPAARSLAGVGNNLVGVFTYEHAFPNESSDFYTPLLMGVESAAESLGVDLLMFTSARVTEGRRRLFQENNRLRLADGCVLLGREMDPDELSRLVESGYPFVAVGRRDGDPRIPYVGADYASASAELTRLALAIGHRRFFYLRMPHDAESTRDRLEGFTRELVAAGIEPIVESADPAVGVERTETPDLVSVWASVRSSGATVVFVEDPAQAQLLYDLATAAGVRVPSELSIVALGERSRPSRQDPDFTRLVAPRPELGARAVELLGKIMQGEDESGSSTLQTQVLLDCSIVPGSTLAEPNR